MREIFKNSFSRQTLQPFFLGVGTVLVLEYFIFPGLTTKDMVINLLSSTALVGLIIFTIKFFKSKS
jgi:hypothetical protein